jgi:CheY-like chemotaxis protein
VLVVEDNPVNRLIVGAMLARLGAQVHEAEDGEQAVTLGTAADVQVHVVLMDLHMPVLDGLSATRQLRAHERSAALPIYALSAAVLEQERQAAADAGMNGFIAKPVLEAELLQVLRPGCRGRWLAEAGVLPRVQRVDGGTRRLRSMLQGQDRGAPPTEASTPATRSSMGGDLESSLRRRAPPPPRASAGGLRAAHHPGPSRQGWRASCPHATAGASRQAVPGGGDLWVAEDHSTMGGAPQASFVL